MTTITDKHYTSSGDHPEDAIIIVKNFINELTKVQESYFSELIANLKLNEKGETWLFDYIYNSGEDGKRLTFEEYLSDYEKTYKEMVIEDVYHVSANDIADSNSDLYNFKIQEPSFESDVIK